MMLQETMNKYKAQILERSRIFLEYSRATQQQRARAQWNLK